MPPTSSTLTLLSILLRLPTLFEFNCFVRMVRALKVHLRQYYSKLVQLSDKLLKNIYPETVKNINFEIVKNIYTENEKNINLESVKNFNFQIVENISFKKVKKNTFEKVKKVTFGKVEKVSLIVCKYKFKVYFCQLFRFHSPEKNQTSSTVVKEKFPVASGSKCKRYPEPEKA